MGEERTGGAEGREGKTIGGTREGEANRRSATAIGLSPPNKILPAKTDPFSH